MFEAPSRTIDAIMRLQPRCSEKMERDSGDPVITTRLLVSSSRIGCIIGKGGAIIKEMRSTSRANIRIFSDDNIPKVASDDDEMIQVNEFVPLHFGLGISCLCVSVPALVYLSVHLPILFLYYYHYLCHLLWSSIIG